MAAVITIIQEIIVIRKKRACSGFLFCLSQKGGKRALLSWRHSSGTHTLLGVLYSGS